MRLSAFFLNLFGFLSVLHAVNWFSSWQPPSECLLHHLHNTDTEYEKQHLLSQLKVYISAAVPNPRWKQLSKSTKHSTCGEFTEVHEQLELFSECQASNNEDAQVPDCCQTVLIKVFDILLEHKPAQLTVPFTFRQWLLSTNMSHMHVREMNYDIHLANQPSAAS